MLGAINVYFDISDDILEFPLETENENQENADEENKTEYCEDLFSDTENSNLTLLSLYAQDETSSYHNFKEIHIPPPDLL